MDTNRLNDAMYTFWRENGLGAHIARTLENAFAQFTVKQLIGKRDEVITNALLKAGLDTTETFKAMQAVRKERGRQYTPAGKLIKKQSNLSPEQIYAQDTFYKDHILYQALGIYQDATTEQVRSALLQQHALMAQLVQQHKKETQQISELYERAKKVFKNADQRKLYDMFGDEDTSPNGQIAPKTSNPHMQPSDPKRLYAILHLRQKEDPLDNSIVTEIEDKYKELTGATYPYATTNMEIHTAARILHWKKSRVLYNIGGDARMKYILTKIPVVQRYVSTRVQIYTHQDVDKDIADEARVNKWAGGAI